MRSIIDDGCMQLAMKCAKFLISFFSKTWFQKSSRFCNDLRLNESYFSTVKSLLKNSWLRASATLIRSIGPVFSISVKNWTNSCRLSSH